MEQTQKPATSLPDTSKCTGIPFEIAQLLKILTRIELRRQSRLRALRATEKC
jgi:hypothetical protein